MSRVVYRPYRGGLDQAMAECKVFDSAKDMLTFVCCEYNGLFLKEANIKVFTLSYYCFDNRINWETFIILDPNGYPTGWCAFNENAKTEWRAK